tara:strand:- start:417 stop:815 length:399 start_codon:yes stop_codon:yes gene_type:complete
MTIHEAGGYLYQWFSDNDCYSPEKDYNKLVLISETNEEDQAAIECALESFEEASIVRKKEINNQTYWVLQKDFALIEQSIPISASTASIVYDHVKMYIDTAGLRDEYQCDPLNISEKDVRILIDSIKILSKK